MKKNLLLTLVLFFVVCSLQAQIQIINFATHQQVQGSTVSYSINSNDDQTNYFYVKNVSPNLIDKVKITRVKIVETTGVGDFFCWGLACYPESSVSPYNSWTSPNGDAITIASGDSSLLTYDYVPHQKEGVSQYRYYVVSGGINLDSVDVNYSSALGLNENNQPTLSIYPNPAKGSISVKTGNATDLDIKIVDMLGTVVYSGKLENATDKIDVSNYTDGIYFVTIGNGNKSSMITKKIIVRN